MSYFPGVQQAGLGYIQRIEGFCQSQQGFRQLAVYGAAYIVGEGLVNNALSIRLLSLPNYLLESACAWSRSQNLFNNISWTVPVAEIAASTAIFYTLQTMAAAYPLTQIFLYAVHSAVVANLINHFEPTKDILPSLERKICQFLRLELPKVEDKPLVNMADGLRGGERSTEKAMKILLAKDKNSSTDELVGETNFLEAFCELEALSEEEESVMQDLLFCLPRLDLKKDGEELKAFFLKLNQKNLSQKNKMAVEHLSNLFSRPHERNFSESESQMAQELLQMLLEKEATLNESEKDLIQKFLASPGSDVPVDERRKMNELLENLPQRGPLPGGVKTAIENLLNHLKTHLWKDELSETKEYLASQKLSLSQIIAKNLLLCRLNFWVNYRKTQLFLLALFSRQDEVSEEQKLVQKNLLAYLRLEKDLSEEELAAVIAFLKPLLQQDGISEDQKILVRDLLLYLSLPKDLSEDEQKIAEILERYFAAQKNEFTTQNLRMQIASQMPSMIISGSFYQLYQMNIIAATASVVTNCVARIFSRIFMKDLSSVLHF